MFRVAIRNLTSHKRRLIGTTSAIVIGVAFLVGTLALSDTMSASFEKVFSEVNKGTDAAIVPDTPVTEQQGASSGGVPESLLATIRNNPDVKAAEPEVVGIGQLVGSDGKAIGGQGPPTLAVNWMTDPSLNSMTLAEGTAPTKPGEVVIDQGSAEMGNLQLGSKTELRVPQPVEVTVVGIATFAGESSMGGTTYTGLTLEEAQKYFSFPGQFSQILVQAVDGVDQEQLVESINPLLPSGVKALTGAEVTSQQNQAISEGFLNFFSMFLLVFAIIALIVASFSIYNTFAVIVAQRTKDSALLRALGATRGQVLGTQSIEALIIGIIASVVGVVVGLGFALGLLALLQTVGLAIPSAGLSVGVGSVMAGLIVGIVVTLFASLFPSINASRTPPLAAMRDIAVDRSDASKVRKYLGGAILIVGLGLALSMLFNDTSELALRSFGAVALTFLGYMLFAPVAAKPVSRILGWPIAKIRGVSGGMAQRNAMRNPRRTASTSAALLVGIAVVSLFAIFASSIKMSVNDAVEGTFTGNFVMSSAGFSGAGYSANMVEEMSKAPGVGSVATMANASVLVNGGNATAAVSDPPKLGSMITMDTQGVSIGEVQPGELAVSEPYAKDANWDVGTEVDVTFSDGSELKMPVTSIYESPSLIGNIVIPSQTYEERVKQTIINMVFIKAVEGASLDSVQSELVAISDKFGAGAVDTKQQFVESVTGQIDQLLTIVYALLFLAIVIALMGIANTLSLSIHERTREIGLLRAVGQTRAQLRSMVRWESVIIALFGTIGGLAIGTVLGWSLMIYIAAEQDIATLSIPVGQLATIAVVGAVVGVLAGLRPAQRAAKLDILKAISTD